MSNSVDPDEMAHYEPSHLDLHCLQKTIIIACGSERVKPVFVTGNRILNSDVVANYKYMHSLHRGPPPHL